MKAELKFSTGEFARIEIIGETEFEIEVLCSAWRLCGYDSGNGQSQTAKGSMGFFIPLFNAVKVKKS